ncbi:hypothetical protein RYH73_03115 [Olivibacter sp. CPCC 100613]|uniref:hypothetical protein n=1 Tax=Olivibacter sp. CPCC 100613 TaxID=3079931 RepID=UPI002FF8C3EF
MLRFADTVQQLNIKTWYSTIEINRFNNETTYLAVEMSRFTSEISYRDSSLLAIASETIDFAMGIEEAFHVGEKGKRVFPMFFVRKRTLLCSFSYITFTVNLVQIAKTAFFNMAT